MKAYCIKVIGLEDKNDPSPFCWMNEEFNRDGSEEQVQITVDKTQALATLDTVERNAKQRGSNCTYQLIEIEF